MKGSPVPSLRGLIERLPPDVLARLAVTAVKLDDSAYLHWDKLRHKTPPGGLTSEEWWLGLKWRRVSAQACHDLLTSRSGRSLAVTRHARIEAGIARVDRLLAGRLSMPEPTLDPATRDQYVASSLMEEAIHSSLFEGAVSTREAAKDLLRTERAPINRDERMILNNYRAMTRLREMARSPLSVDAVLELHRILTDGTLEDPTWAGRLQTPDEHRVQVVDHRMHRVVHEPPPAAELTDRLQRLVDYANADDVEAGIFTHPVVRSILLHFQLAYDHPFHDGNGRTARALFYWSMLRRGYWLAEYLSISRLLYRNRGPYEQAFVQTETDEQDGTYFVLQQLGVLEAAIDELFEYVSRKSEAQQRVRKLLRNRKDLNHRQLALLDHAMRKPDTEYTHESHANSHRVSIVTARSDLVALVERRWLRKVRTGKRFVYVPVAGLERKLSR